MLPKLKKRTWAAVIGILLIPAIIAFGVIVLEDRSYYFVSLLILAVTMLPFLLVFEHRKPMARELVLLATLSALAVAGRAAFFMLPQFKPVMAMTIISGVALGGESGFLVVRVKLLFRAGPLDALADVQLRDRGVLGWDSGCPGDPAEEAVGALPLWRDHYGGDLWGDHEFQLRHPVRRETDGKKSSGHLCVGSSF